jgi:hypothetical protein
LDFLFFTLMHEEAAYLHSSFGSGKSHFGRAPPAVQRPTPARLPRARLHRRSHTQVMMAFATCLWLFQALGIGVGEGRPLIGVAMVLSCAPTVH